MTVQIELENTPVFKTLTQILLKSSEDTRIYVSDNAFVLCKEDELKNTLKFINNMDKINEFCIGSSYEYFIAQVMCLDDEIAPEQSDEFGYIADLDKFIKAFMCANDTVPMLIPASFNIIKVLKCHLADDCPKGTTFTVHSINI